MGADRQNIKTQDTPMCSRRIIAISNIMHTGKPKIDQEANSIVVPVLVEKAVIFRQSDFFEACRSYV